MLWISCGWFMEEITPPRYVFTLFFLWDPHQTGSRNLSINSNSYVSTFSSKEWRSHMFPALSSALPHQPKTLPACEWNLNPHPTKKTHNPYVLVDFTKKKIPNKKTRKTTKKTSSFQSWFWPYRFTKCRSHSSAIFASNIRPKRSPLLNNMSPLVETFRYQQKNTRTHLFGYIWRIEFLEMHIHSWRVKNLGAMFPIWFTKCHSYDTMSPWGGFLFDSPTMTLVVMIHISPPFFLTIPLPAEIKVHNTNRVVWKDTITMVNRWNNCTPEKWWLVSTILSYWIPVPFQG